jgi:hypothetical protein
MLFLVPIFTDRVKRHGVNDLLRNAPLLQFRVKLACRLLGSVYKQGARDRMGDDFHTRSICDPAEVIGIGGFLKAIENISHLVSHLCRVGHPGSFIFLPEPPYYAIVEKQLLDFI